MSMIGRAFDPIWAIFDPLWSLIGRNMYLTAGALAVACVAGMIIQMPWVVLFFGLAAPVVLMLKAEEGRPSPGLVEDDDGRSDNAETVS